MNRLSAAMRLVLRVLYALIVVAVTRYRFRFWSGRTIARYQRSRRARIVAFARRRTRFYGARSLGAPPVSAAEVRAAFATSNTLGLDEARARRRAQAMEAGASATMRGPYVGYSSGTSGDPGLFVVSEREAWGWTGLIFSRLMPGSPFAPRRIAFFLRANSPLYEQLSVPWVHFEHFGLALDDETLIQRLEALSPDVLFAPPSMLRQIVHLVDAGRLAITPNHIFCGAEMLWPDDERAIRETFGVGVREVYQATEGIMAVACPEGALHWQEDLVALDLAPADLSLVDDTCIGEAIVTSLHRRAQPIVDVALGDLLRVTDAGDPSDKCACGSAFRVVQVQGRTHQMCRFGPRGAILPRTLAQGLCDLPGITDFRIRQHRTDALALQIKTPLTGAAHRTLVDQARLRVMAALDEAGTHRIDVSFDPQWQPSPPGHKRVRVVGRGRA